MATNYIKTEIIYDTYYPCHKPAIWDICIQSAYFGQSCDVFFPDPELLADVTLSYYTLYEPHHVWVALHDQQVVGYLTACFNLKQYYRKLAFSILPKALFQACRKGKLWDKRTSNMLLANARALIKGESRLRDTSDGITYTGTLHINVTSEFRGQGIGQVLVEQCLKEADSLGIHLLIRPLRQENRWLFFERYGFHQIDCKQISTWEPWLGKSPLFFMTYGRSAQ